MSSNVEKHREMIDLVKSGAIIPGIYKIENGVKVYNPITEQVFLEMLENEDVEGLAYNTYTMGRGIFTLGYNGEIINFKGVDSLLPDEDNIAIGQVDAEVYDITQMLGIADNQYGITAVHFPYQGTEIRVRGASQLQNLVNESQKLHEIKERDKRGLIKLPEITEIVPFSDEFCKNHRLPIQEPITEDFMQELLHKEESSRERTGGRWGNYGYACLQYMQSIGMDTSKKNQTWKEYFLDLSEEDKAKIESIPSIKDAIKRQDRNYELGATFGQTTRILENPFRIMDLAYFVDEKKTDSIRAIIDYSSSKTEQDFLIYYAETMGKNLAGFMNNNLAYDNWVHRQDFALSAEMCDDAYDDITDCLDFSVDMQEDDPRYKSNCQYNTQFYLFASNMKVIEQAYRMIGKEVPENYQSQFIDKFICNVENKEEILKRITAITDPMEMIERCGGESAIKNFEGYEEYLKVLQEKLQERTYEISEQAIAKSIFKAPVTEKGIAEQQVQSEIQHIKSAPNLKNQGVIKNGR